MSAAHRGHGWTRRLAARGAPGASAGRVPSGRCERGTVGLVARQATRRRRPRCMAPAEAKRSTNGCSRASPPHHGQISRVASDHSPQWAQGDAEPRRAARATEPGRVHGRGARRAALLDVRRAELPGERLRPLVRRRGSAVGRRRTPRATVAATAGSTAGSSRPRRSPRATIRSGARRPRRPTRRRRARARRRPSRRRCRPRRRWGWRRFRQSIRSSCGQSAERESPPCSRRRAAACS